MTINNTFKVSTNYETTRKWFNEIIDDLENESDVTGKSHDDIVFEWEIATGVWLPLNYHSLSNLSMQFLILLELILSNIELI